MVVNLPKAQINNSEITQDILNANIEGDLYNKKYVQSANYINMLRRAGEK